MNNYIIATEKIWNVNNFTKYQREGWFLVTDHKLLEGTVNTLKPKIIFFPHWSWKIPKEIYEKYECVIFHGTNLPIGRGKEPFQWLIEGGYENTYITVFKCTDEIDAGEVYTKIPLSLSGSAEEVYTRCSNLIFEQIKNMIIKSDNGITNETFVQSGVPSECGHPTPEILLDAIDNLEEIYNKIRAWDAESYPKANFDTEDFNFEFSNAIKRNGYIEAHVRIREI